MAEQRLTGQSSSDSSTLSKRKFVIFPTSSDIFLVHYSVMSDSSPYYGNCVMEVVSRRDCDRYTPDACGPRGSSGLALEHITDEHGLYLARIRRLGDQ
jgi:hypothetical protein